MGILFGILTWILIWHERQAISAFIRRGKTERKGGLSGAVVCRLSLGAVIRPLTAQSVRLDQQDGVNHFISVYSRFVHQWSGWRLLSEKENCMCGVVRRRNSWGLHANRFFVENKKRSLSYCWSLAVSFFLSLSEIEMKRTNLREELVEKDALPRQEQLEAEEIKWYNHQSNTMSVEVKWESSSWFIWQEMHL
jgi:hypothetical protein